MGHKIFIKFIKIIFQIQKTICFQMVFRTTFEI